MGQTHADDGPAHLWMTQSIHMLVDPHTCHMFPSTPFHAPHRMGDKTHLPLLKSCSLESKPSRPSTCSCSRQLAITSSSAVSLTEVDGPPPVPLRCLLTLASFSLTRRLMSLIFFCMSLQVLVSCPRALISRVTFWRISCFLALLVLALCAPWRHVSYLEMAEVSIALSSAENLFFSYPCPPQYRTWLRPQKYSAPGGRQASWCTFALDGRMGGVYLCARRI